MSIFDVLRYNLSIPPTADELAALPSPVYQKWLSKTRIVFPLEYHDDVANACYRITYNHKHYPFGYSISNYSDLLESLSVLKRILYEYKSTD